MLSVAETEADWFVVQTQPCFEFRVRDRLHALGQLVFLPLEHVKRTYETAYGRRTREWDRPLYESYVMFAGDRSAAFDAGGMVRVLSTTDRDREAIENLMLAHAAGPVRRATSIKKGQRVRIISGAFMGVEGFVDRYDARKVYLEPPGGCDGTGACWAEIGTDLDNIEIVGSAECDRLRDRQHGRRHELRRVGR